MRELSKFCWIYCKDNHKKCVELSPFIENWINNTVASATGYTPTELMYGSERRNVFSKLMPSVPILDQRVEEIDEKLEKAHYKIRERAENREKRRKRGSAIWEPKVKEKFWLKHNRCRML